jgi:hypothetical protein
MILNRRAQSTAEYAVLIGLVAAVTAGVLSVALKGAIRQKNKQAMGYLLDAGNSNLGTGRNAATFTEQYSQDTVSGSDFASQKVMKRGGLEESYQKQKVTKETIAVESINESQ